MRAFNHLPIAVWLALLGSAAQWSSCDAPTEPITSRGGELSGKTAASLTRKTTSGSSDTGSTSVEPVAPITLVGETFTGHAGAPYVPFTASDSGRQWLLAQLQEEGGALSANGEALLLAAPAGAMKATCFSADGSLCAASSTQLATQGSKDPSGGSKSVSAPSTSLVANTDDGSIDLTAWSLAYAPAELSIALGGEAGTAGWTSPELPDGPHLFATETWEIPTQLTTLNASGSQGGGLFHSTESPSGYASKTDTLSSGSGSSGSGWEPSADLAADVDQVVRYSCCNGVVARSAPNVDAAQVFTLQRGDMVWVTDLATTTGLQTVLNNIADCQVGGDPNACANAVTQIANTSKLTYYAKVFSPKVGATAYVPIQSLFVRPLQYVNTPVTFELTWGTIAEGLAGALQNAFVPPGCNAFGSSVVDISAGLKDLVYDPTARRKVTCDEAMECLDWATVRCPDDIEGDHPDFGKYLFANATECVQFDGSAEALLAAHPDREPSKDLRECIRNICPNKVRCAMCREWIEETGQDITGHKTVDELVAACEAQKFAESDEDVPLACIGGTKPNCVDVCMFELRTEMAHVCANYIPAWQTKQFSNPADYECGELPAGATHVGLKINPVDGEWVGSHDFDWKLLSQFELFDTFHEFEMGRLDTQTSASVKSPDLTTGGEKTLSIAKSLSAANVRISLAPAPENASLPKEVKSNDVLWVQVCGHLPGVDLKGPSNSYPLQETRGFIHSIDFGQGHTRRVDICGLGALWLDKDHKPAIHWVDASINIDVQSYSGFKLVKGPSYYAVSLAASVVPVLGVMVKAVVLAVQMAESAVELLTLSEDTGAWLVNALFSIFESKMGDTALKMLTENTKKALDKVVVPNPKERLSAVCNELTPNVPESHPYHYFYRFITEQCNIMANNHLLRPFQPNAGSVGNGCYDLGKFFSPTEGGTGRWWEQYVGQMWWLPLVPDSGCRMGAEVLTPVDVALAPVLRCGAAMVNIWLNDGERLPESEESHSDLGSLVTKTTSTGSSVPEPSGLPGMVATWCSGFGYLALDDLYGDGMDLVELYNSKHAQGPGLAGQ